jgi:serine/threonine-protein kinase
MGEVYRATDTNLKRQVAIKVLPASVAGDAERLARFQREAEILAALNHPTIAHVYGLEKADGTVALVMELIEGPTLADRIVKGPIPIDEALPIARQIAEALEAAHEQGIIHRDLKPANVKVRPDGTVKVLDFGLAKALEPVTNRRDVSQSPTITSPAMTQAGMILGTAAYMSPEQAKGRAVDKRSDLWAFGAVLYEMLTGARAFDGEDVTDTIVAVMSQEPDWTRLPAVTPASIRRLLRRTLARDQKRRLADAADARAEIDDADAPPTRDAIAAPAAAAPAGIPFMRRTLTVVALALSIGAVFAGTGVWLFMRHPAVERRPQVRRFALPLAVSLPIATGGRNFALSADGSQIGYLDANGLSVRRLDQPDPIPLPTGPDARQPFFSPDAQWVAYFTGDSQLKKMSVSGRTPIPICRIGNSRGGTWLADGSIVFGTLGPATGLLRVSSDGGEPQMLTVPDPKRGELGHYAPEALPGGRGVLFTVVLLGPPASTEIAVLNLRTGEMKVILRGGGDPHYVESGHLVYLASGAVRAVPFDLDRLEVHGSPTPVLEGVAMSASGFLGAFATSGDGSLVYAPGRAGGTRRSIVFVDRQGHETPLDVEPRAYGVPRISPEGTRIAVYIADPTNNDVHIYDLQRKRWLRLTFDPRPDIRPVWTPDGRWVLFRSDLNGPGIYRKASDGSGAIELLTPVEGDGSPNAATRDGKWLIFNNFTKDRSSDRDLWIMSLDGDHNARPLVAEPGAQGNGSVSPDGRWLAYGDETNGSIIVRPFPNVDGGRWEVATGSKWPLWSHDGRELFYLTGGALMSVGVDATERTFQWTSGNKLFEAMYDGFQGYAGPRNYDLTKDGQFLFIKSDDQTASSLLYVENWSEEIKAKVATK